MEPQAPTPNQPPTPPTTPPAQPSAPAPVDPAAPASPAPAPGTTYPAAPPVTPTPPQPPVVGAPQTTPTPPAPGSDSHKLAWLIGVAVIVFMLIIIGVGLALINKLSDSKTTPSDNAGSSKVAATAKTPATNACTLVTADEASKVISKPLQIDQSFTDAHAGKPQVSSIQAESVCPYVNKDNSLYGADIRAYTPGSYSKAVPMLKQSYDETKKAAQAVKGYQDISGLGDDAYWDAAGATLYVFKNDSYYRFGAQIPGAKESTLLAKDQVLANILLAKLPN